jgi:HD superfamily phosphodiesterase
MKKKFFLTLLFLFISNLFYSQSKEEANAIISNYDLSKIKELQIALKKKTTLEKQKAEALAKLNNWPIREVRKDGSISELMKLTPDGFPVYFTNQHEQII